MLEPVCAGQPTQPKLTCRKQFRAVLTGTGRLPGWVYAICLADHFGRPPRSLQPPRFCPGLVRPSIPSSPIPLVPLLGCHLHARNALGLSLLLVGSTATACGGRSQLDFGGACATHCAGAPSSDSAATTGSGGSATRSGEPGDGGNTYGSVAGMGGANGSTRAAGGSPSAGSGGYAACGDRVCDVTESTEECPIDCLGGCDVPADLTSWANVAPFVSSGVGARNRTWLSCSPTDGPEVAYRVEFPVAGILRVSTESTATLFDTVLAIRSGDCDGREIDCNNNQNLEQGELGSNTTAWLNSHEPGIILVEAASGTTIGQFSLTLEFVPDVYDFDFAGTVYGALAGCSTDLRDVWGLHLIEDERVEVTLDTRDAFGAADLALLITNQTVGGSVPIDDVYECTYPPPFGGCPSFTFTALSTGPYTFTVSLGSASCSSDAATYSMEVLRQNAAVELELLEDG